MKKKMLILKKNVFKIHILEAFFLWKCIMLLFAVIGSFLIPLSPTFTLFINFTDITPPYLWWIWANFDGSAYLYIAQHGYYYPNFAYFPLYSLVISLAERLTYLTHLETAIIVSNIAILISLFVLYYLCRLDYSKKIAYLSVILMLMFPLSFYYGSAYTDSLYVLFAVSSFYSARKSKWFWAGVLGYFASLTRLIGVVLFIALLCEFIEQQQTRKIKILINNFIKSHAFWLLLIPLGIITYGSYLQINFGDFFLFQKSMGHWNQSNTVTPFQVLYRYLKIFINASHNYFYFIALVEFIATLSYFALTWFMYKKIRLSYTVFTFLTFLIPTLTGTLQGMPRYILHAFPAFIALSLILSRNKKLLIGTIILFLVLQLVFITLFTRGYFVA